MNAFDFSDLTDIEESNPELAKKVALGTQDSVNSVVGIFAAGLEAGKSVLTLAQVMVAAVRLGIELPSEATVRKYVNTAIEQGKIIKVTRQSYALPEAGVEASEDAQEADDTADEEDDLGDLD